MGKQQVSDEPQGSKNNNNNNKRVTVLVNELMVTWGRDRLEV